MASRGSDHGQITIDRSLRNQLGVRPGMVAHQRVANGHLDVVFLPEPHSRSLYGAFRRDGEMPGALDPDGFEEAVMAAVAEEQRRVEDADA